MINSYKRFWNNIFDFSGVANRPDYWWPVLVNAILGAILTIIVQLILGHPIDDIYNFTDLSFATSKNIILFLVWLANLSVSIRRLHDTNRSGWWYLISFVPLVGTIWFFILTVLPSKNSRWN